MTTLRLEPELFEAVQNAFPTVKGRSGGASLAIRKLLHLALESPMPRQFGEIGRAHELDALEVRLLALEGLPFDKDQATAVRLAARKLLALTGDAVDALRLRALLGRLHLWEVPLTDHERRKS